MASDAPASVRWSKRRSPPVWRQPCPCLPRPASPASTTFAEARCLTAYPPSTWCRSSRRVRGRVGQPVTAGYPAVATQARRSCQDSTALTRACSPDRLESRLRGMRRPGRWARGPSLKRPCNHQKVHLQTAAGWSSPSLKLQYSLFKVYSLNIPISLICRP